MKKLIFFVTVLHLLQSSNPLLNIVYAQSSAFSPVLAHHGMVASSDAIASKVGVEILKQGGNAVDAAVAVALALAVTWPNAGNLGGGGFMLIRKADGTATLIDYRETAPRAANKNIFLDDKGNIIQNASTVGYRSVGVPGTIAGLALALEKYGTMKWKDVIEPARKLAEEGFILTWQTANYLQNNAPLLGQFRESNRIFLREGKYYQDGEIFKQPDLAQTLTRLKNKGPREFYEGHTALLITDDMKANNGLITVEDLKNYKAVERAPLKGTYRGYEILSVPPPSSGGTLLIQMLNILEQSNIAAMGHNSSEKYHLLTETMRRAYADRAIYFGDPAFVNVPVTKLTSKGYAAQLAKSINKRYATPSSSIKTGQFLTEESKHTTHFSIVDSMGNAVSNTYTLNGDFGSGVTVTGAGFLLNNEMDDFTSKPGIANKFGLLQGKANTIEPGKRPLSSMTPSMILKDGTLFLVVGTEGGSRIISQTLQVIVNVIDHRMNIQEAVNAPRIHQQWMPDEVTYEPYGLSIDVLNALKKKGHKLKYDPGYLYPGDVEAIMIDLKTGVRLGASDPRNSNALSAGY
jgi:gamma-glutamyltranspeptidase/glutathione hydrolase